MYIEPTITRVLYGLTQKLCLKNIYTQHIWVSMCIFFLLKSKVHVGAEVEGPPILILPRAAKCLRPGLGVGDNSIMCIACHRWVHKRCSGISGRLGYVADFRYKRCSDGDSAQVVLSSEVELEPGVKVECVSKFCYLGDTLGSGGGVVEAARARVRCAWAKFKQLSPILTVRGASSIADYKTFSQGSP